MYPLKMSSELKSEDAKFKNVIGFGLTVWESAERHIQFRSCRMKKMTPWSIFEDPLLENQMSYQLLIKTISIWNSFAPRVRRLLLVSGKTLLAGLERAKNLNFWVSDDVINSYFPLQQPDLKDSKVPPFTKILWKFQKIYSRFNPIQDEGGGRGGGKKAPYQFFHCNFYKRRN